MWNLPELRKWDRLFDQMLAEPKFREYALPAPTSLTPACDVSESDTHYIYSFDMPGMNKDEIKVELNENMLRIFGERKEEHETKKKNTFRSERFYGAFERFMGLPANTSAEQVEANYENGVLTIVVPKVEAAKTKQIKVAEGKHGVLSRLLGKKETASPANVHQESRRERAAS